MKTAPHSAARHTGVVHVLSNNEQVPLWTLQILSTSPRESTVASQKQSTPILQPINGFITLTRPSPSRRSRLGHKRSRCRGTGADVCARFEYSSIAPITAGPQAQPLPLSTRPSRKSRLGHKRSRCRGTGAGRSLRGHGRIFSSTGASNKDNQRQQQSTIVNDAVPNLIANDNFAVRNW